MRRKRSMIIIIVLLVVGFAAVSTTFIFKGSVNIGFNQEDFDVYFSKAIMNGNDESSKYIIAGGKKINFLTQELKNVGEQMVLDYQVTNYSQNYDAIVEVVCTHEGSTEYVKFENSLEHVVIPAKTNKEGKMVVTLIKSTIEDKSINISCSLNVEPDSTENKGTDDVPGNYAEPTNSFSGTLKDNAGNPIKNAVVIVESNEPVYTTTDDNGYFYVSGLEGTSYDIKIVETNKLTEATKQLSKQEVANISEAKGTISLDNNETTLTNNYKITNMTVENNQIIGTLQDKNGNKVVNATVVIYDKTGKPHYATTDNNGNFQVTNIEGENNEVEIILPDKLIEVVKKLDTSEIDSLSPVSGTIEPKTENVTLPNNLVIQEYEVTDSKVSGVLKDKNGKVLSNTTIVIYNEEGTPNYVTTDENGYFEVSNVTGNKIDINIIDTKENIVSKLNKEQVENIADSKGNITGNETNVTLTNGLTVENIETQDNTLKGTLKDSEGKVISNATVVVYDESGTPHYVTTDASGNIEIKDISGSNYEIKVITKENEEIVKELNLSKEGIKNISVSNKEVNTETSINIPDYTISDTTLEEPTTRDFEVKFIVDGEIVETRTVTQNSKYGTLTTPEKTGYTFNGWYINDTRITENSLVSIQANTEIIAKWNANKYNITFNSNGGNEVESKEVTYNGLYGELVTPTKAGYTFLGWYNGEEVITSDSRVKVTANTTLTAKWNANKYIVNLNTDGGDASVGSIEVTYDGTYTNLPTPTKAGYTFTGWYNGSTKIENSTKVSITEDTTLVAKWNANKYTVTFNANTGNVTTSSKEVTYNGTYGELPEPTKAGYTFNGWYTDITNGTQVTDTTVVKITSNQTLYAHWTANSGITYKVYHWQQNVGGDATKHDSTNYTLVNTDTKTGTTDQKVTPSVNTYTGFTSPSTQEITVKADGSAAVNYYYTRNEYNLTINKGTGVTSVSGNGKHQYGKTITIGYSIANGYSFKDITGDKTTNSFTMPANDVTVTVNTIENTYTITYTMNNGTNNSSNPTTYKVTSNDITLKEPTREGYTFTGWTGSNGASANKNVTIAKGSYENKSYTANWTANTYTVSFNSNGGNTVLTTLTVTYDGTYGNTLPTPTREGYTFNGWYTDATNGNKVESTTKVSITANQTLYAHWIANTYTITYNLDLGTAGENTPSSAAYDSVVTISKPLREGYVFEGWTITSGLNTSTAKYGTSIETVTSAISSNTTKVKAEYFKNLTTGSSVTLTANWKEKTYEITNDVDGNGIADIGDEIKVGTESFYVISHIGSEINALAKYNLKVGGAVYNGKYATTFDSSTEGYGRQDAGMRGWVGSGYGHGAVVFSNSNGWPYANNDTINIKAYDGPVKDALYGANGYEKYIQKTISTAQVRLITKGEIENLINDGDELVAQGMYKDKANAKGYSWIYSTTYWTQSAYSGDASKVWTMGSDGGTFPQKFDSLSVQDGVRPVIAIPDTYPQETYTINYNLDSGTSGTYKPTSATYGSVVTISNPTREGYIFTGWTITSGLNTSTAKYGASSKIITSAISSSTTKVKAEYFKNLTTGLSVTLTANWEKIGLYLQPGYYLFNDINDNGIADIGDEIRVGTESFYVISHTETELNALAKYNLNVGNRKNPDVTEGIQHETVRGWLSSGTQHGSVNFSKANGWPTANNATIDIKNEAYRVGAEVTSATMKALDALYTSNETTGIKGYEEYIQETIPDSKVRLITKGEIEELVNDGNNLPTGSIKDKADAKGYSWLYYTTYWIGSAYSDAASNVWTMGSDGKLIAYSYSSPVSGVRPVITIPE